MTEDVSSTMTSDSALNSSPYEVPSSPPLGAPPVQDDRSWGHSFGLKLACTDAVIVLLVVFGSELIWFGSTAAQLAISGQFRGLVIDYSVVSLALSAAWLLALSASQSRDVRILGLGTTEYKRVVNASFTIFGLLAVISYLLKLELARGYFLTAVPIGLFLLLLSRWLWRKNLQKRRMRGEYSAQVLLVGSPAAVAAIGAQLQAQPEAGYFVVGACIDRGVPGTVVEGTEIPVLGKIDTVLDVLESSGADTLVVTSSRYLSPKRLREISWGLEPGNKHLVMAPSLVDVAGPRIHSRPVAGLPLIHVETPRYIGWERTLKRGFDVLSSGFGMLLLSPLLLILGLLVKFTSPGPVFFLQERVGINGKPFKMVKFRSMVIDAEEQLQELSAQRKRNADAGNTVMFKMADDPRITPIGKFLRRYSLDELPQLINVFKGDMSLVGPRPPLPSEVEQYKSEVFRKFLVKPGITGLWQVSGRSDLSWEESVRIDLYYVENWSLTADMQILFRTAKAVFAKEGAY